MRAGLLTERIRIDTPTTTQNAYGESTTTWSTLATVWASVDPLTGSEGLRAKAVYAECSHKIVIRWLDGVTQQCRVYWNSQYLDIMSVADKGRADGIEIIAKVQA